LIELNPPTAGQANPEVYHPFLSDEIRRQELSDRLAINSLRKGFSIEVHTSIVESQIEIERKMEEALLSEGYSRENLINKKRHEIRGFLFYPRGTSLSQSVYEHDLNQIRTHGTHRSPPYTRLMPNFDLLLGVENR